MLDVNRGDLLFCPQEQSHVFSLVLQLGPCLQSELNEATAPEKDPNRGVNCDHKGQRSHIGETF